MLKNLLVALFVAFGVGSQSQSVYARPLHVQPLNVDLNGRAKNLRECGGQIAISGSSRNANQITIRVYNTQFCSNLTVEGNNQTFKLQGRDNSRSVELRVPLATPLRSGWNSWAFVVHSNSNRHMDRVIVPVYFDSNNYYSCYDVAKTFSISRYMSDKNLRSTNQALDAQVSFARVSNQGNHVYFASVYKNGWLYSYDNAQYEVTVQPGRDCHVLGVHPVR